MNPITKSVLLAIVAMALIVTSLLLVKELNNITHNKRFNVEHSSRTQDQPAPSLEVVSEIPDDGQPHIIHETKFQTMYAKVIHASNSYTSHVIWVENKNSFGSSSEIKLISTH